MMKSKNSFWSDKNCSNSLEHFLSEFFFFYSLERHSLVILFFGTTGRWIGSEFEFFNYYTRIVMSGGVAFSRNWVDDQKNISPSLKNGWKARHSILSILCSSNVFWQNDYFINFPHFFSCESFFAAKTIYHEKIDDFLSTRSVSSFKCYISIWESIKRPIMIHSLSAKC